MSLYVVMGMICFRCNGLYVMLCYAVLQHIVSSITRFRQGTLRTQYNKHKLKVFFKHQHSYVELVVILVYLYGGRKDAGNQNGHTGSVGEVAVLFLWCVTLLHHEPFIFESNRQVVSIYKSKTINSKAEVNTTLLISYLFRQQCPL